MRRYPLRIAMPFHEVEGDIIVHDRGRGNVHRLNGPAAVIWYLCDGRRDVGAIASDLGDIFGERTDHVGGDVEEMLARLADQQLIEWKS